MCLRFSNSSSIYICNPITRKLFKLPEIALGVYPRKYIYIRPHQYGFGFDATTNKYKVVFLWCFGDVNSLVKTGVLIRTLGSNKWRRVEDVRDTLELKTVLPVLVNGALHWEIHRKNCFGAIDIGTEKFRAIEEPPCEPKTNTRTLTCPWESFFYGEKESWSKDYIIKIERLGPLRKLSVKNLGNMGNGSVVILHSETGDQGYYDLITEEFKSIKIRGIRQSSYVMNTIVHVGSFISPKIIAGTVGAQGENPIN
ncbi:hypothetical protein AQUCO_03300014v1 [Aquilegia coerulea]|uniref:F-box associated beta-propeller type 3 domain-containing protein n=1 Tax=Aquilegia coerulea TaxID=218851 RepID=A0A2G5CZ29_AQUCA|nr:hypothetical protein AQUCO_03300014v1 [Aquilegia coerulea]